MSETAKYALEMLYTSQKCMKIALSVDEGRPDRAAEVASLQNKLEAVDYLIGLVHKEG